MNGSFRWTPAPWLKRILDTLPIKSLPPQTPPARAHKVDPTMIVVEETRFDGKRVLVLRNWIHYPDLAHYSCYLHHKLVFETEEAEEMAQWVGRILTTARDR